MILTIVPLLVIAIAIGLFVRSRTNGRSGFDAHGGKADSPTAALRLFTYIGAFAGLLAVLYAVAGLLALLVATLTLRSSTILGAGDLRDRTSFYLAALIVGLPLWLGAWRAAQRAAARSPQERDARERRLFLAAVFGTTSVMALVALHDLLAVVLTWPGPADGRPSALDGIVAGARLLAYGSAWLVYARIGWREHSPRDEDDAHDLAVYLLTGVALTFFAFRLAQALRQLVSDVIGAAGPALLLPPGGSAWTIWGTVAAWIVAGGLIWGAIWRYDLARRGFRRLRVAYLYLVLVIAAPVALGAGTDGLYELLRKLFGYRVTGGGWDFLRDVIPPLLVGGLFWAYHWAVLRSQVAPKEEAASTAVGAIAWPRRPAIALLALAGLGMAAPALISILWLGLDAALNTGTALSGPDWWRDRLSLSLAAGLIGTGVWLGAWSLLQRAAGTDPGHERAAQERRLLVGGIALLSGLTALGFTIALLWLLLRTLLGESLDANGLSTLLKDLSAAVILAALAAYHGLILRGDLRHGPARGTQVRMVALLAPGADAVLAELRRNSGQRIDLAGYLAPHDAVAAMDLAILQQALANLGTGDGPACDRALLIVHPDGGTLYQYTRAASRQPRLHAPAPSAQETVVGRTP